MSLKISLSYASAFAAVIASFLWYKASATEVSHDPDDPHDKAVVIFSNGDHQWDVIATAELQTKWNKRAAFAASMAAIIQAVCLVVPD
ncbi:hypothetical protein [Xanthomonas arboricola]|uniref:hypothetical protein n=1 Tax=Xanthomonas arboricola TaxID=56448 RepID=UPI0011AF24ED|nr:hypothetical protein [Xanthomonas arboricola]MBB4709781.1 hypothetical protein [Xanthomonas arboricola]